MIFHCANDNLNAVIHLIKADKLSTLCIIDSFYIYIMADCSGDAVQQIE